MFGIIKTLGKALTVVCIFFALSGAYFLVKPESPVEIEEEDEFAPVKFRASDGEGNGPTLYFTVNRSFLEISPLVNSNYDYEIERLVYFADETDPVGFELTLTSYDGSKKLKAVIHRARAKFHTNWKYKVRYEEGGAFDDIKQIAESAKKNIMCVDFTEI